MRRKITFLLKILIFAGVVVILYLSVIIGIATVTDYKPEEISELEIRNGSRKKQISDSTFTFLSWNVGYFGLGAEMDFFYEGGKMVNPKKELVEKYSAEKSLKICISCFKPTHFILNDYLCAFKTKGKC
jgi:hypothetical protein